MSDYEIKLTPSELRKYADEIERYAEIVRKEVQDTGMEIDSLRPTFLGQSATKFFQQFNQSRSDMEQWDKIVRNFAVQLREAADRLQRADQANA